MNDKEILCSVDLGSDCSIIKESEARLLNLKFKETNEVFSGFDYSLIVPIAYSKINLIIDDIELKIKIFIVPDDQLSKRVLIGRNIIKTGIQAITDASCTRFIKAHDTDSSSKAIDLLTVENVETLKPIEEKDVHCEDLGEGIKKRLISLLNRFRHNLAFKHEELGHSKIGEMKIELLSDEPVYHRPYRMSKDEREKLNELIMKFDSSGIIRESTSPHASPAFLVTKKNGEGRMVVDFRQLNKITKLACDPLPLIDDQIDRLGGQMYLISLDMKSGFYQIPVHPDSIEKTAFITPDGHWEFLRMAMGLANSPAIFQRAMNKVLKGTRVTIYKDDVLLAVKDIEEGLKN